MSWWKNTFLKNPSGGISLDNLSTTAKVLGGTLGAYGLSRLASNSGTVQEFLGMGGANTNQPRGYQGGIPEYTATRTQLPITATQSDGTPRRPGSGGRRYFSDMTYTPTGKVMQGAGLPPPGDRMSDDEAAAFLSSLAGLGASGGNATRLPVSNAPTPTQNKVASPIAIGPAAGNLTSKDSLAEFAKKAMAGVENEGRAIDSGEAATLLSGANALGVSPKELADMLGVPESMVTNRLAQDYPNMKSEYLSKHGYARGGLASLPHSRGYYLGGPTDGMADKIPARIDGKQEAALSDGEFVIPADIVSHLGNGNSQAGAQVLYQMMDRVRRARTGTTEQGRQINPNKYTPA